MHRACNRAKGDLTIAEYKARQAGEQRTQTITNLVTW